MAKIKRRAIHKNEWQLLKDNMIKMMSEEKGGSEGRETVPEIACARCANFSDNIFASDGRGFCKVLKVGSDFSVAPPVFITEGEKGMMVLFNMDSSACKYFDKMSFIDTDGKECSDPQFQRAQRQMTK